MEENSPPRIVADRKIPTENCLGDKKNIIGGVSMAKYWTTEMASRVADRCMQLFGGYGYCEEYPIARAWRDIRVTRIFAGTNEIMKTIAARFMGL